MRKCLGHKRRFHGTVRRSPVRIRAQHAWGGLPHDRASFCWIKTGEDLDDLVSHCNVHEASQGSIKERRSDGEGNTIQYQLRVWSSVAFSSSRRVCCSCICSFRNMASARSCVGPAAGRWRGFGTWLWEPRVETTTEAGCSFQDALIYLKPFSEHLAFLETFLQVRGPGAVAVAVTCSLEVLP